MSEADFHKQIKKFNKVVIWGLRTKKHTHRYIHHHFYVTLKKLGTTVAWVDDKEGNASVLAPNDLVISVGLTSVHLPIKDSVYYCLHNCSDDIHAKIDPSRNIRLQVYTNPAEQASEKWDEVTLFDKKTRTLFQPWATNLLPDEFKKPISKPKSNTVIWVGSIWNNELDQGNINEIQALKYVLKKRNIKFVNLKLLPDSIHTQMIRYSRIAPAIAGRWQAENNYLPCRMWKNISYGQLGVSNVKKFESVFQGCSIGGDTIEELIDNTLSIAPDKYRDMVLEQQEIVKKHTFIERLTNIMTAFEHI